MASIWMPSVIGFRHEYFQLVMWTVEIGFTGVSHWYDCSLCY